MKTGKSIYNESNACVKVNGTMSEWFEIYMGLCLGCIMSLWQLTGFRNGSVCEMRMR